MTGEWSAPWISSPTKRGWCQWSGSFRDSIVENREPLTSGAVGIDDLSVVLKAYESIEQGMSLPLG